MCGLPPPAPPAAVRTFPLGLATHMDVAPSPAAAGQAERTTSMTIPNPIGNVRTAAARPASGPILVLTGALAATLAAAAVLQPSIAREALVPVAATLLLAFAAAVGAGGGSPHISDR